DRTRPGKLRHAWHPHGPRLSGRAARLEDDQTSTCDRMNVSHNSIGSKPRRLTMACTCIAVTTVVLTPMLAFAADDAVAGQHAFATHCASCHGVTTGAKKMGPTLAGVFGGASGGVAGFNYSPGLENAHLTRVSTNAGKRLRK